jgi:hypothetical protein
MKKIVVMILVCLYGCSPVKITGTTDETELSIKGCVTSDNGAPAAAVAVQLFTKNSTVPFASITTTANGLFKFEKMTPGTYSLWAELNDSIAATSGTFTLSSHDSASHNLILVRGGSLTAYVKISNGKSTENVAFSVPGTPRVTTADSLGVIKINNMAQGNFSLFLMDASDDYDPVTRPFTITGPQGDTLKDTIIITLRNPKPTPNGLWDITSGNGITIAVGSNGTVLSSTDGINWINRISDQFAQKGLDFNAIAWGNNRFVALDNKGFVFQSPNGITWLDSNQQRITSQSGNYPISIVFANNQFIVYDVSTYDVTSEIESDSNIIWTSENAITWTSHEISFHPKQIIGNGTELIAVTFRGIFVSSDAQNWTKCDNMFVNSVVQGKTGHFLGIHHKPIEGNEYFCKTQIVSSCDGHQWAIICDSLCSGGRYLLWGKNRFNLFNSFTNFEMELFTSVDGKTWINEGHLDTPFNGDSKIQWNGERFICIGSNGLLATSEDGIHWNEDAMIGDYFSTLVWNGTEFVGVRAGLSMFSSTGSKWTKRINDFHSGTGQSLSWGNGKYISESGPYAYTSPDAQHWTEAIIDSNYATLERIAPDSFTLYKVVAGKDRFVAYAYPNHFYMSLDGLTWKRTDVTTDLNLMHKNGQGLLFYKDSQFIAVDNSGLIYLSKNGSDWTIKNVDFVVGNGNSFAAINTNIMIVVNSLGNVIRSLDNGETWISNSCPEINDLSSLLWDGDQFVATTDEAFWTSSDGISWRRRVDIPEASGDFFQRYNIHIILTCTFDGKNYVIITNTGSIYTINKFTKFN